MDERVIRASLAELQQRAVLRRWPLGPWKARTADFPAVDRYDFNGEWRDVTETTTWPALKTLFLRAQVETPSDASLPGLRFAFDISGLEGLLSIDGRPYAGIDNNHTVVDVPRTGRLDLEAEFTCLGAARHRRELRAERARLRDAAFIQVDRDIEATAYDILFAWQASQFAADERRQRWLHQAVEEALLAIDLTAESDRFSDEVTEARERLQERIRAIEPDPETGRVFLTGHSHIDVAWLWPLRETVRKCSRTFSTACRLMERYPDYHFSCSQPQLYAYTKAHYPQLYEEIKEWVASGRWECTGGMWVESDCNVPSGESLIRQVLLGLDFFRNEFDARPRSCWLPDVFGYPGSLPGILKGCGLDYFFTCKLHWQARNPFPRRLFWWEGIDGTRVLAHIPRLNHFYNGRPSPEDLAIGWQNFLEKDRYDEFLLPFGHGDGGGGPTEEMLEFAARASAFPGLPAARQGVEETYFDDVISSSPDLPAWVGELYLETHRGTYTTQSATKRANRKNELLLRESEIWGTLASAQGIEIDLTPLRAAWENLLLLQFHDILPGSSIGEVYDEAAIDYAAIGAVAREVRDGALVALTERMASQGDLVAYNSLPWLRRDVVRATIPTPEDPHAALKVTAPSGETAPAQIVARGDGTVDVAFVPPDGLPPLGFTALRLQTATASQETTLTISERMLENRFFRVELDAEGTITRLLDKRAGREVLPPGARANDLQLFQDGPEREAAWNIHATYEKRRYDWDTGTRLEVVERGPVQAAVRVIRHYRDSRLEQEIRLYDRLPRIDFVTSADWNARQVMLKAAFPVAVRAMQATYEIQFGAIQRPTHRNTSWDEEKYEVCAHRWADLSEAGYGVSLLNDSRYGHDTRENVLRLTLLRGTQRPDPEADRGRHMFVYSLLPHAGDWRAAETVRRAWELNAPAVAVTSAHGTSDDLPAPHSFLQVTGPAILETVKPAEDGDGLILRLYEPYGGRGSVTVRAALPIKSVTCVNHVEEPLAENQEVQREVDNGGSALKTESGGSALKVEGASFIFDMGPFQVRTFRLRLA